MVYASSTGGIKLDKPRMNIADQASLQRGSKYFVNYCAGCHSLKYIRYERIAEGLGLVDNNNDVLADLVKDNLIFTTAKITDPVINAIPTDQVKEWFGMAAPDLSLKGRERGSAWLYTYLRSFYRDENRPLGSNNLLFPDVGMPNVLEGLQGIQIPIEHEQAVAVDGGKHKSNVSVIEQLKIDVPGTLTPKEFDGVVTDLVNFLSFVSEPAKIERFRIGVWVLLFFLVFLILTYLVKKEYWKDVD